MPNRRQAIIWINDGPGYRRIYASLGLSELIRSCYFIDHTYSQFLHCYKLFRSINYFHLISGIALDERLCGPRNSSWQSLCIGKIDVSRSVFRVRNHHLCLLLTLRLNKCRWGSPGVRNTSNRKTGRQQNKSSHISFQKRHQWPNLLSWFNFNPSMDK